IRPFYDTRSFADTILATAEDLGLQAQLPWATYRDFLRELAQRLKQFNRGNVSGASFETYWNNLLQAGGWWDETARYRGAAPTPQRLDLNQAGAQLAGDAGTFHYYLVPFPSIGIGTGNLAH